MGRKTARSTAVAHILRCSLGLMTRAAQKNLRVSRLGVSCEAKSSFEHVTLSLEDDVLLPTDDNPTLAHKTRSELEERMEPSSKAGVPTLEQFLAAPPSVVAEVAPKSILLTQGGTRRRTVLRGVTDPHSEEYRKQGYEDFVQSCYIWFKLGVQHVFAPMVYPPQVKETNPGYRRLQVTMGQFLLHPKVLARWEELGWRVRMVGHYKTLEGYDEVARVLNTSEPARGRPTLWLCACGIDGGYWEVLTEAILAKGTGNVNELRKAIYGEDFPGAELHYSFGKPVMDNDYTPPVVLESKSHCYWAQVPGYPTNEELLRRVIYDFAYLRHTWKPDKEGRYDTVIPNRAIWERPLVLGIGRRLGAFWYPEEELPARSAEE